MQKTIKMTTGLAGLDVCPNPHHTLSALYGKILRVLAKMPCSSVYKQYTENIVRCRQKFVDCTPDIFELEQAINAGQTEELIAQAENELSLARSFLEWKPWEPLTSRAPKGQWDWPPYNPDYIRKPK